MEIAENRQWKMMIDGKIACIWATTFSDPQIWGESDRDPAVYIHRIATNPDFRGNNFVTQIVTWAEQYARENAKEYIRMDTIGENRGLIEHYEKCGFEYLGYFKLGSIEGLPDHYALADACLFEKKVLQSINAHLKSEVKEAMEQIERGEYMEIDEAFDRVIAKYED